MIVASDSSPIIALAKEIQADLLLMDERRGRKIAGRFGHRVLGVLGVLVLAKERGQVESVAPILDSLLNRAGFRVSRALEASSIASHLRRSANATRSAFSLWRSHQGDESCGEGHLPFGRWPSPRA